MQNFETSSKYISGLFRRDSVSFPKINPGFWGPMLLTHWRYFSSFIKKGYITPSRQQLLYFIKTLLVVVQPYNMPSYHIRHGDNYILSQSTSEVFSRSHIQHKFPKGDSGFRFILTRDCCRVLASSPGRVGPGDKVHVSISCSQKPG